MHGVFIVLDNVFADVMSVQRDSRDIVYGDWPVRRGCCGRAIRRFSCRGVVQTTHNN